MSEEGIRKQLDEVGRALTRNETEHEVLLNLLKGFEGWLRLNSNGPQLTMTLPAPARKAAAQRLKNPMSFRKAVVKVLQEAHGEPLKEEEIWRRIQDLGVRTTSEKPLGWVGFLARKSGAEKVAPRTWRLPNGKTPTKAMETPTQKDGELATVS